MISPQQIKGARAMLDLSQDMLAMDAGISPATVFNLEKGQLSIGSANKIRAALEKRGIEFIGSTGVNRIEQKRIVFDGPEAREQFYDLVLTTVQKGGDEIVAVYRTPELFARSLGIDDLANLGRLQRLANHARIRCLLSNAQGAKLSVPYCEFRSIPRHPMNPLAVFVFGDNHAIVTHNNTEYSFFTFNCIEAARAQLVEFETHWQSGLPFAAPSGRAAA